MYVFLIPLPTNRNQNSLRNTDSRPRQGKNKMSLTHLEPEREQVFKDRWIQVKRTQALSSGALVVQNWGGTTMVVNYNIEKMCKLMLILEK